MEERVLVVPTELFRQLGYFNGFSRNAIRYCGELLSFKNVLFRLRNEVESDPNFKQLIPYMIFSYRDPNSRIQLFQYVRGKGAGEKRLHSKRSVGVGGHISSDDLIGTNNSNENGNFDSFGNCLSKSDGVVSRDFYREGMLRELREEVVIGSKYKESCVGLINDDNSEVGSVHLGIVHLFELEQPIIKSNEEDLIESGFVPVDEMLRDLSGFESWSAICIESLFGQSMPHVI
ncbi:MAG: phosphoesterase [Planctomycetaceae bacterium]|jgi:predicted NUDIX family phosphoesterase|nr:phosphoesterase [Planctomycetaceae bacterium]